MKINKQVNLKLEETESNYITEIFKGIWIIRLNLERASFWEGGMSAESLNKGIMYNHLLKWM